MESATSDSEGMVMSSGGAAAPDMFGGVAAESDAEPVIAAPVRRHNYVPADIAGGAPFMRDVGHFGRFGLLSVFPSPMERFG